MAAMLDRMRGILEVIEYLDPTGQEIVHRVPEEGSGEIVLGSQLVVRENQVAVFFRDGRALDSFAPGRHTITTANVPLLTDMLGKLFDGRTPFPAEVDFVNTREFPDVKWGTPQPIIVKNPGMGLGVALLQAFGNYSFFVSNPQQFVTQVVGAQGIYGLNEIQGRFRTILLAKLADMLGELGTKGGRSVLDIIGLTEEIQGGVRAKAAEEFLALGITLKTFGIESIKPSEKSAEELRAMGMLDMATYTQLQAADAMRDAARNPSGGAGLTAGIGAGIGIGNLMGQALQGGMTNTAQGGMGMAPQQPQAGGGGGAAPAVMSPGEAANYLKVAESDVMSMITDGTLKSKKIGTQIRISKQALDDFLNS
jgi:excisionase family DNA binding protein